MFKESLRGVYTRPMGLTNDDLALAVMQIGDLKDKTKEEITPNIHLIVEILHTTIFADWWDSLWASKVNHLITYYSRCETSDLTDLEVRLIQELLDINMEEELVPSVDALPTLEITTDPLLSSYPTIPIQMKEHGTH